MLLIQSEKKKMASTILENSFPIHEYLIRDTLGQGAFGVVSLYEKRKMSYLTYYFSSTKGPDRVAVKIFQPRDIYNFSKEFENMVKIGANKPQNIVEFYGDCALQGGKVGLVMELFESDLMQYIYKTGSPVLPSLSEAKLILGQMANGLKHLKMLNIVHRDVKPENVLVKTDGNGGIRVALTDLGVSKRMTETQRSDQTNIGTHLWMAPEVRGDRGAIQ